METDQKLKKANRMRWLIRAIVFVLVVIIGLCIWQYPESYEFFQETISDLGMINSHDLGYDNTISRWIFTIGFFVISIMILILFVMYLTGTSYYVGSLKVIILICFFVGALGTAFPYDSLNIAFKSFHFIGAALFVGGFGAYNFVSQLLRYIRKHTPKPSKKNFDYFLDLIFVILVLVSVVWYLVSGLLGLLHVAKVGFLSIFQTAMSQKVVLIVSSIAAFLLDKEDI